MKARNILFAAPPFDVEKSLVTFGANLRTARLRRNLTVAEVAQKIGTGSRAVTSAEKGKASTGIAVYAALLWAYGLLNDVALLADPNRDEEGAALARFRERERPRSSALDNDF
jgi:transcriptional regulator with XRE-family HTH domain